MILLRNKEVRTNFVVQNRVLYKPKKMGSGIFIILMTNVICTPFHLCTLQVYIAINIKSDQTPREQSDLGPYCLLL